MRVATFNVRALPLMPQEHVIADANLAAANADVILWQEIHPDRYKDAVMALGDEWDHFMPTRLGNDVPISWRKNMFVLEDDGVQLLHDGIAKVCNNRAISWVRLRPRKGGASIVFNDVHYVARAWHPNGTPKLRNDPKEAATQPLRQGMWNEGNASHIDLIEEWVAEGLVVIGGGDYNRGGEWPVVGKKIDGAPVKYLMNSGIDYLWAIDGDTHKVVCRNRTRLEGHSDHALKVVDLAVKRRIFR